MNKESKYITVLDFEVGRIFQYKSENFENSDDYEQVITDSGHNLGNCEWMVHDDNRVVVQTPYGEIKQLQSHYDITK